MTDQTQATEKQITIPVKSSATIDVLTDNMIVVNGKTYCGSAEQFHAALKTAMGGHPFADPPKPKRTRGPNQPKPEAGAAPAAGGKKGGK